MSKGQNSWFFWNTLGCGVWISVMRPSKCLSRIFHGAHSLKG
jgi:hypothetical protein